MSDGSQGYAQPLPNAAYAPLGDGYGQPQPGYMPGPQNLHSAQPEYVGHQLEYASQPLMYGAPLPEYAPQPPMYVPPAPMPYLVQNNAPAPVLVPEYIGQPQYAAVDTQVKVAMPIGKCPNCGEPYAYTVTKKKLSKKLFMLDCCLAFCCFIGFCLMCAHGEHVACCPHCHFALNGKTYVHW